MITEHVYVQSPLAAPAHIEVPSACGASDRIAGAMHSVQDRFRDWCRNNVLGILNALSPFLILTANNSVC
eukprot:796829-Pleurochrysis_carterae.AAC.1